MCGIWALLQCVSIKDFGKWYASFMKIKHRGPDYSSFDLIGDDLLLGFHRLAIMDLSAEGNQSFHHVREDGSCVYCVCNGEIYDYEKLKQKYGIVTKSHSDCEVIIPLYEKLGIDGMVKELGSEFACIIIDISKDGHKKIIASRDPIGVRPLFYGVNDDGMCFSSEMKGLCDIYEKVYVFPPGHYMTYENGKMDFVKYYSYNYKVMDVAPDIEEIYGEIRNLLIESVKKRLQTDRPIGALLSGGFDSSIIVGIMKYLMPNIKFPVFTIVIDGKGTDLEYAEYVSKYLDLNHCVINISEKDALALIDETIISIGSWDITSIRASAVQLAISKYINQKTDIKVFLCGENSDEVHSSYLYNHNAPSSIECRKDSIRLVKDVHMFDGLRTDRTMSQYGLEVRLPFADKNYVDYIFSLPSDLTSPKNGIEKGLIRDAFRPLKLIPESVLDRKKEAMSDGCSGQERSWYEIIQEHIETLVTNEEYEKHKNDFEHYPPFTKESYYYRKTFSNYYGSSLEISKTIPYFWMPKWTKSSDPSARTLKVYNEQK